MAEVFPEAERAAHKALELDSTNADAHFAMGWVHLSHGWRWADAERAFRRALALRPDFADAHYSLAYWLQAVGRTADAVEAMRRARALEPFAMKYSANLARMLVLDRRYDEAIEQFRRTEEMFGPTDRGAFWLTVTLHLAGRPGEARTELARLESASAAPTDVGGSLLASHAAAGLLAALAGDTARAARHLAWAEASDQEGGSFAMAAIGFGRIGQADRAFRLLERAYDARDSWLFQLHDPLWDPLREDARFAALLERVGLAPRESSAGA